MPKESLCVVIPVHKPVLSDDEEISLNACKRHLKDYDCYLVFPRGMNTDAYTAIFSDLLLQPVDPVWLSTVEQYNKMKLSISFYEKFVKYKFMLTYELDAYIFNANFDKAKVFSFDFIGAPFFEGFLAASSNASFTKGCNSGFSVRNIQTCMHVLRSLAKYEGHWTFYKRTFARVPRFGYYLNKFTRGRYDIYINGVLGFHFDNHHINEDIVWSQIVPRLFKTFAVADPKSALRFSFEHNPERLLELNGGELPLGCHAWNKYSNFWKKYITD